MSRSRRLLAPYLGRQWPALAVASAAAVVSVGAELARPFPLKIVVDHLIARSQGPGPSAPVAGDVAVVVLVTALVIGIAAFDAIASYQVDVRLQRAGERIVDELRVATYAHLQRLSLAFHERRSTGDLVTRVTSDVGAVGDFFSESLGTLTVSALLLAGMLLVGIAIDPILAAAAFVVAPLLALVTIRARGRLKAAARRQRAGDGEIASIATEALSAVRVMKAFGSEGYEHDRLRRVSHDRREAGLDTVRLEARYAAMIDVLGAIGTTLVLVIGIIRVIDGALTPGDLIVMATYSRRIYRPLRDIARQAGRVARAMARADRVGELLAEDDILPERPGAYDGPRAAGDVRLDGVTFGYGRDEDILEGTTVHVPAGQKVALMGRSGAGKSTFVALIARFYDPTAGAVLIDGRDARDCALAWFRRQVGVVLADTTLFSGTVAENISYGQTASREAIVAVARAAGADEFIRLLPQGYETSLGPRGLGLSTGQRQRIGIARTLLRDPAILVLDEPTSGLDADSQAAVLAGLDALAHGRTTLLITHSTEVARTADRLLILDEGRIVRDGDPGEILSAGGPFGVDAPAVDVPQVGGGAADRRPGRSAGGSLVDPALPQLGALLNMDSAGAVLERALDADEGPVRLTGRYLRYKPGTSLLVHYEVDVAARRLEATLMIASGRNLARRTRLPESLALASDVRERSGVRRPLAYDETTGALIQWLPLDLWLPALGAPPDRLRRSLRAAGVIVATEGPAPTRLAYKPRRRAVLRLDDHVVKIHATEDEFRQAAASVRVVGALGELGMPHFEAIDASLRLIAQTWVPGQGHQNALAVAEAAGALLSRLHAVPGMPPLPVVGPMAQLDAARASARLAALLIPSLGHRLDGLIVALEAAMPQASPLVVSHGDFDAAQLLVADTGSLRLVDIDSLCLAPAGFDMGNYVGATAADPGLGDQAMRLVREQLLRGYGQPPPALCWYISTSIVRRVAFPFRRFEADWPVRMDALVGLAEASLAW